MVDNFLHDLHILYPHKYAKYSSEDEEENFDTTKEKLLFNLQKLNEQIDELQKRVRVVEYFVNKMDDYVYRGVQSKNGDIKK